MATPIGTNEINSLSRRYIVPRIYDNFYKSNLMFFRLVARNKRLLQGGLQIEVPLLYTGFAAGGAYSGFDVLDVSPSDTIKNGAWDWRQYWVPVTVDGLTLIRADSPDAVVNFLSTYFENAQMQMAEVLGVGVWSDGVANTKAIDGLKGAVDDGTTLATYGGLSRSANTWFKSQIDTTSYTSGGTPVALKNFQTMFGSCTEGGRHPTIIVATQAGYNIYWNLSTSGQSFPVQPQGHDEQLAQNGFTNMLFNNVPVAIDSHVPANHFFFLNEDFITLYVNNRADFNAKEFREPVNQDVMTSLILWAGNLVVANPSRNGKMTSVAG